MGTRHTWILDQNDGPLTGSTCTCTTIPRGDMGSTHHWVHRMFRISRLSSLTLSNTVSGVGMAKFPEESTTYHLMPVAVPLCVPWVTAGAAAASAGAASLDEDAEKRSMVFSYCSSPWLEAPARRFLQWGSKRVKGIG